MWSTWFEFWILKYLKFPYRPLISPITYLAINFKCHISGRGDLTCFASNLVFIRDRCKTVHYEKFPFPCSWIWNESLEEKWKRCFVLPTASMVYTRHHLPFPTVQWLWRRGKINEAALGDVLSGCAEQKGLTRAVFAPMDPRLSWGATAARWQLLIWI